MLLVSGRQTALQSQIDDDHAWNQGQASHWTVIHKHMCRVLRRFEVSLEYQASPSHRRLDSFLLSHLVAEHAKGLLQSDANPDADIDERIRVFNSLLPHSNEEAPEIFLSSKSLQLPKALLKSVYNRFGNNNFVIHSQLHPVAHGIFPTASRLFNHSCAPNAIVGYRFHGGVVRLLVKVLSPIEPGEEVLL